MNINFQFELHGIRNRKILLFIFLITITVLTSSCFVLAFSVDSTSKHEFFTTSDKVVSNEMNLQEAVNNAMGPVIITLGNDVMLTNSAFVIPAGKNVTLTSSAKDGFFKLIGANNMATIVVEQDGVLILDGIVVTHISGAYGQGISVMGTLIMYGGTISGNTAI